MAPTTGSPNLEVPSAAGKTNIGPKAADGDHSGAPGQHHHDVRGRLTEGIQFKHYHSVRVLGKIGWVAKGIVYAILGGLCCKMGVQGSLVEASPQGVFVILGSGGSGKVLLIIEMAGVVTYIIWRWWEGITQQGANPEYSKAKNFFSFRLSPLVSGCVYLGYFIYCCTLLPKVFRGVDQSAVQSDFTRKLQNTWYGRGLLVLLGLAFTAASITQVEGALTRKIHREIKLELNVGLWWAAVVTGHVGIAGRAVFFILVAVLFYRSVSNENLGSSNATFFSNALQGLRNHTWGRVLLFFVGFALIVYGLFCCFVSFFSRIFPTPGPTTDEVRELRRKRAKAAAKKEKKATRKANNVLNSKGALVAVNDGDVEARPISRQEAV